jgi:hypothetical protein
MTGKPSLALEIFYHEGAQMLVRLIAIGACAFTLQTAVGATSPQSLLRVGTPTGLPGFALMPDGRLRSTDPYRQRLTDCIERKMNVKFEWVALPTKRALGMLVSNELDLTYPMGFSKERSATLLASLATWENPDYLVSMHPIDMNNKAIRAAARIGSPQHTDYIDDGFVNFTPTYTYEELGKLLARDAIDVAIVNKSIYFDMKNDWTVGHLATEGRLRSSGFYLNKDDPKHLRKILNASITKCVGTGLSK